MTAPTAPRPPSVERLLAAARAASEQREHFAVVAAARDEIAAERARLAAGQHPRPIADLAAALRARLARFEFPSEPVPIINATGVLIHTNLGRATWPRAAIRAAEAAASGPLFLELDPRTGRRGRRFPAAEEHLVALTGAEDALVTNNCAAALVLAVGLAGRKGVVVGRGELVEIGGGVRIPEIVRRAGARLIEVGTTNRTRVDDYEGPLRDRSAAMVLRVHPSNFTLSGFVERPDAAELAALAHAHGAVVVDDLGSGAFLDTAAFGLAHEPTPAERLLSGADLVVFSGDKLVGGPQAGLVVGRADLVERLRKDPLARAMRPDKTSLAGVAATLGLYRAGIAGREIPVWRMMAASAGELRARADALAAVITRAGIAGAATVALDATLGGGSLPGETLPSFGLALEVRSAASANRMLAALRTGVPAVLGRIVGGRVVLDLRTVDPAADLELGRAVQAVMRGAGTAADLMTTHGGSTADAEERMG